MSFPERIDVEIGEWYQSLDDESREVIDALMDEIAAFQFWGHADPDAPPPRGILGSDDDYTIRFD